MTIWQLFQVCILLVMGTPIWLSTLASLLWLRIRDSRALRDPRGKRLAALAEVKHPPVPGVTHHFVDAAGLRIHVARAAIGEERPLVLLIHGWPEFWYSWRHVIPALTAAGHEVAAVDLPGFNASEKPRRRAAYLTEVICTVLAAVVAGLGRDECAVVGHDWGGAIALDLAALYPNMVTRVASLCCVPTKQFARAADARQRLASAYMTLFQAPVLAETLLRSRDYRAIRKAFTSRRDGGLVRRTLDGGEVEAYVDAIAVPGALAASLNLYRAAFMEAGILRLNARSREAWRAPMTRPALIVFGDSDVALLPNLLIGIGTLLPRAAVHVLPRCSHWVQQDAPDEVNALLCTFLAGQSIADSFGGNEGDS